MAGGLKRKSAKAPSLLSEKREFCRWCRFIYRRRLVAGSGGNLSARFGDLVLLTPTGVSLRDMTPDLVVEARPDGTVIEAGAPTREASMHLQILYRRPDARVVCHVHGAYVISCASLLHPGPDSLPPVTPGFAYAAHPLEMLPFLPPGSSALASKAAEALSSPKAKGVLLQSHGLVTIGKDYREAVNTAEEIEEAARIFFMTNGKAPAIPLDSYLAPQGGASGTP